MDRNSKTTKIIVIALLIAAEVVLTRFLSIQLPTMRIGFGFIPIAIAAMLYGPVWAGLAHTVSDLLGIFLFPAVGGFFPGFTLTACLTGVIFGLVLYKKDVNILRAFISALLVVLFLNLILDTYWLVILTGKGFTVLLPARILKCAITLALQTALLPIIYHLIVKRLPFAGNQQ
ncbi:MAG: folate family ECF transporter S component [Peptostreptococcaceae bacterium]|nr:folate family ECF transporter S component [Peptostreptococcaceae bacterium]MDY5738389.1 folate family ECF transporter S component [Anaerovoracaceae bacterium]